MEWYEIAVVIVGFAATFLWIVTALRFDSRWLNERRERTKRSVAERRAAGYNIDPQRAWLWAISNRTRAAAIAAIYAIWTLAIAALLASD